MAKGLKRVLMLGAAGFVGILALLFVAGVAIGYLSAHGAVDVNAAAPWVLGAFAIAISIGSLWLGSAWMRSIDEAAQEAHKWAWYWGGSTGMTVGCALLALSGMPRETELSFPLPPGMTPDPAGYAAAGAFAMLLLMIIGYAVAWAFWWWRRR